MYELQVLYKSSGLVLPSAYLRWCWYKLLWPCKLPKPLSGCLSKKQLDEIRQWVQQDGKNVRQNTTRNFLTKDKPGTLPLNLYESTPPEQHSIDFEVLLNEYIPVQRQDNSTARNIVIAQSPSPAHRPVFCLMYLPCF